MDRPSRRDLATWLGGAAAITAATPPLAWAQAPSGPAAAAVAGLPAYRPAEPVSGTISVWGHGSPKRKFIGELVESWAGRFNRHQPGVRFDYRLYGTASAIGALYTGAGNLALLGEEISPDAARAFQRARGYPATGVSVATGSLDVDYFDYAHMIFVNAANPLRRLSLSQLDAVFGAEHRRAGRNIRSWGELGLGGAWAGRPIQPYAWKTDDDFGLFFRERVLDGSHRWNPRTREFANLKRPDGTQYDRGQQIVDAVAADANGIGISNVRYATSQVRTLALAWRDEGPFTDASEATLISMRYPLTRIIPAYFDRAPGRPVEPAVREFLRFVLSREGQQTLVASSQYLPLSPAACSAQLEKLS